MYSNGLAFLKEAPKDNFIFRGYRVSLNLGNDWVLKMSLLHQIK